MNFFNKIDGVKKRKTKETFEFILYNIDPQHDNNKYLIDNENFQEKTFNIIPENNIEFKLNNKIKNFTKEKIKQYLSMIDNSKKIRIPLETTIPCMGCHRKYTTCPLGVPIKYISNYIKITLKLNECEVNTYKTISTKETNELLKDDKFDKSKLVINDYFVVDSMVCSFNCILTVYNENPQFYKDSITLMYLMYYKLFGEYPDKPIIPAPSWRMRKEYDGCLTDEEFSNCLQVLTFMDSNQLQMRSYNRIYETLNKT